LQAVGSPGARLRVCVERQPEKGILIWAVGGDDEFVAYFGQSMDDMLD
jgi:hypothetical protein